jgi:phenylacetate-CoA ligase
MARRHLISTFETVVKRRPTFRYWRDLEQSQWHTLDALRGRQLRALQELLHHAESTCPLYRRTWEEKHLDSSQVQSLEDIHHWPLIDRATINAHRLQLRSSKPGLTLIHKATGGSSGEPLRFDLNTDSDDRRMAAWHRGYGWAGAEPGTRQVYLWGVPLGKQSARQRWKDRLYYRLYNRHVLNTFDLNEETVPEFLRAYNRRRPDVFVAYTNPLYCFAKSLDQRGLRPVSPKSIVVGAEKLHDFQRVLIERVFSAPVFETYGSREFMLIGAECDRHKGLHLTMEHLLVEIVDDEGRPTPDGEEGNVVITDLYNYGMPFIRYLTGDRAIAGFGACDCGRGLPLLRSVVGRRLDVLTTPDGRSVPGEFFPHLLKDYAAVRRFQVVQECAEEIVLKLVVDDRWSGESRDRLRRDVTETIGDAVRLVIREVDDIPLTHAGKLQVVVNRCRPVDEICV